jgi:hypothetical protein
MLTHARLARRPRAHAALTGLTLVQFNQLLMNFIPAIRDAGSRDRRCRGIRGPGAGRPGILDNPADALVFILVYFRQYPTQELQGILFGISQQQACALILKFRHILERALGRSLSLPNRAVGSLDTLVARVPDLRYIIDGCERQIYRPQNGERQKACYSGKKKRHMVKNTVVISSSDKRILAIGITKNGATHDKRMMDEDRFRFPDRAQLFQDTGYLGHSPDNCFINMPAKKPKGGELTVLQKFMNKAISKVRVRVEHSIAGIKRNRICSSVFRNRADGFTDQAIAISAGLFNFTIN